MNNLTLITAILALFGSAIVGGIFFAFSSFIMKALARLPSEEGISAMQSINIVVLNHSFLGIFLGTTVISLLLFFLTIIQWNTIPSPYFLTGALFYILGTFLVTGIGNVPLNNQLANISNVHSDAILIWQDYILRWTRLNTFRTACALIASMLFIIGLIK